MKAWTSPAEQRLAEYLQERVIREGFDGEDASELKADLKQHIYEEAERAECMSVGVIQLETILSRMDAGYSPGKSQQLQNKSPAFFRFCRWVFGVVLPAAVILFELLTSFCGSVFFSPIPTLWHALWLAMVPLLNSWQLLGGKGGGDRLKGLAAGFSLMTASFYAFLFLPLFPFAVLALILLGLGILPMIPIFAALCSARIGRWVKENVREIRQYKIGWRIGIVAGIAVWIALEAPALWTRNRVNAAIAQEGKSTQAISQLRWFHSEHTLLMTCYEGNRGRRIGTDISGWMTQGWEMLASVFSSRPVSMLDSEKARNVFFRVTGKPFNSIKPPSGKMESVAIGRNAGIEDEFEFDAHLGGDEVAVRLKNLNLAESRFDGHVDTVSQIGYGEWTMVFKNESSRQREARCQVRLPAGGRVSRLTLWVNGEPQEAAFSSVSKVKAAYKAVAVEQRRDPVLVNMIGPDTILVQCFPVPANGLMKIRFGVTAPLDRGTWELPYIIEENFGTAAGLESSVWLQGDSKFRLDGGKESIASHADGPGQSLTAGLKDDALMDSGHRLVMEDNAAQPAVVWCEDRFAKDSERFLLREPQMTPRAAAKNLIVVIDGSLSMRKCQDWITKSLSSQSSEALKLILADDQATQVTLDQLKNYHFSGGRDNEPALREAIRLAKESNNPIIWLHGPQAIGLAKTESLNQLLERGSVKPVIYDVEAIAGPNRLSEALYKTGCIHRGPSISQPQEDFSNFVRNLLSDHQEMSWNWKRAASADGWAGAKVWDHLARLWAVNETEDHLTNLPDETRSSLAAKYQLVTPHSGAVVLETAQQYKDHGLEPVDGSATPKIPNVPEPSTSLLIVVSLAALTLRRKRESSEQSC